MAAEARPSAAAGEELESAVDSPGRSDHRTATEAGPSFAERLIVWAKDHGRHDLPWQRTREPYRVWLSEVMLQQTQVATATPYYQRWLARFPDIHTLAQAELSELMPYWAGLGYYARVRNLHACAQHVVRDHDGHFPSDEKALAELPGIGASTAAAVAAFCFDRRAAILDGNVKRVLARQLALDMLPGAEYDRTLKTRAEAMLPLLATDMPAYTQALMDLGATCCTRRAPKCERCPVQESCVAFEQGRTNELPRARVRRAVPLRSVHMLVITVAGAVWLQRRPPKGVWAGLFTLPEFSTRQALEEAVEAWPGELEPLTARRHSFTHFTLEMTPYRFCMSAWPASARPPGEGEWTATQRLGEIALPAPLRRLLLPLARTAEDINLSMHTGGSV